MIRLPDPEAYEDPIRYFRDCHGVIGSVVDNFERMVRDATQSGLQNVFSGSKQWQELLEFFVHAAPVHELDEERALFPIVLEKMPHLGFQSPGSPSRFIHEEHEVMQQHAKALLALWRGYMTLQSMSADDEKRFLDVATELVKLYREHISIENNLIYTVANDNLLTPAERIAVMILIREQHGERTITPMIGFEDTIYKGGDLVEDDAVSGTTLETDDDDSEEEDEP